MVAERTGSLSGIKRHDYLPFGEEIGVGGRTAQQGYVGDSNRFKFTGYERDNREYQMVSVNEPVSSPPIDTRPSNKIAN